MKKHYFLGMALVILAAAALRLWALPDYPLGLHYDEAANVILTRNIAMNAYRPLFIRAYTGKEVLFFYAAAPWIWITGGAAWGLRLGAAMLGILTVASTFSATRALLSEERHAKEIALFAAAWVAIAFPHVLLSRYGFRAISQPLLQALTVTALWHGIRTERRYWLAAAGVCLGLTGYTYLAARLFPIPLALAIGWLLGRTPKERRKHLIARLGWVALAALITFAPLGFYFMRNPQAFTTRITQVAAPTWRDALHGLWLCVQALVRPGAGDPYVRFNLPGRPVLDIVSALLAVVGFGCMTFAKRKSAPDSAARLFMIAVLGTMVLPSALATSEITPSNLRMVGLYPFIAILPAYAVVWLSEKLSRIRARMIPCASRLRGCILVGVLAAGGTTTGWTYHRWATSRALFDAADGDMVLAASIVDTLDTSETTLYIASEHYRHPTVAALAQRYPQAKWLTGGATLVLPPTGHAVYLIPQALTPPSTWPDALTSGWTPTEITGPGGNPALLLYHITAEDIAPLRPTAPRADFAHVVQVYDARLTSDCYVAEPCTILVIWEARAPYTQLQPVVRLLHPTTNEWTRTTAFHYPPEQWTPGDIILDQFIVVPPVGTPPGGDYQIGVGFFNPDSGDALPRLQAERFAGLDVRFPINDPLLPMQHPPTPEQIANACAGMERREINVRDGLQLTAQTTLPEALRPGETVTMALCWQAINAPLPESRITFSLVGPETRVLYTGTPGNGYGFSMWSPNEIVEDRYGLRLPKDMAAGQYSLNLSVGDAVVALGAINIQAIDRGFVLPEIQHALKADFGASIRLHGYDIGSLVPGEPLDVTFYWQSLAETQEDYVIFVHLLEPSTGRIVTQVDEGPQKGKYPTSLWVKEEIIVDPHTLTIPADLATGSYRLRIGFYVQETGDTLPIGQEENLLLPPIETGR